MKKNVFTKLNFTVSGFCGSKRRRRFIALLSLFGMLIGSTASAIVIPPFSGEVLPEVNGNGGAFITGTTEYIKVDPAGAGNNASISLVNGFNAGLINWSALSIGQGQSISFIGDKFFNVVEGTKASEIAGTLNANGSVWIFNPAGISFIDGAQVNVGGFFSAVAAGLANKDEMAVAIDNTGTVMDDPVLDNTVVGKIAVENGVVFGGAEYDNGAWTTTDKVGNGVVLAGKSVTVEDGVKFNANNVTLAAGGKLVIDNVNEGKVTFKITDFADNVDDVFVSFQDTDSSDATDVTTKGDLEVFTEGSVNVNETVKADGNIYISGAQEPSGSAPVIGVKQMTVASGKLIQGKSVSAFSAGKISADGDITATDGDITLEAIEAIELGGAFTADPGTINVVSKSESADLTITGSVEGDKVNVTAGIGKGVAVSGSVSGMEVTFKSDVTLSGTGKIQSRGVLSQGGKVVVDGHNLTLDNTVSGTGGVSANEIVAARINVEAGKVDAETVKADVVQYGGTMSVTDTVEGSVTQYGGEFTGGTISEYVIQNNSDGTASMVVDRIDGALNQYSDNKANITVSEVGAGGISQMGSGKIIAKDGNITVDGSVTQYGGSIESVGNAVFNEVVAQESGTGVIGVSGTLTLNNGAGQASSDSSISAGKLIVGNSTGYGQYNLTSSKNDFDQVEATAGTNPLSITDKDGLEFGNVQAGNLTVKVESGSITQAAGAEISVTGMSDLTAESGDITLGGENDFSKVVATAENVAINDKNEVTLGNISADGSVKVSAVGDVTVDYGAEVISDGTSAGDSAMITSVSGDVIVSGAGAVVLGMNEVTISAGSGKTIKIGEGGAVTAENKITLTSDTTVAGELATTESVPNSSIEASGVTITVDGNGALVGANVINAGALDINAGEVLAKTVSANVVQDGGTMTVTGSVTGNVTQKGAVSDSFTAASVSGDVKQESGNLATVTTGSIGGNLEQSGGKVVAQGDTLTVTGTTTQNGGEIGDDNDAITFNGKLTQTAGTVSADTLAANDGAEISGMVTAHTSLTATDRDIEVKTGGSLTAPTITAANLKTAGTVTAATAINANVEQTADEITTAKVSGTLNQTAGTLTTKEVTGAATVAGTVNGDGGLTFGSTLKQTAGTIVADGDLKVTSTADIAGTVNAADAEIGGKLTQPAGELTADALTLNEGAAISGTVTAGSVDATGKDVEVSASGVLTAPTVTAANLKTAGSVTAATAINANVEQTAGEITTAKVSGTLNQTVGTLTTKEVTGAATVAGIVNGDGGLAFGSTLEQTDGKIAANGDLTLGGNATVKGDVEAANIAAGANTLTVDGADVDVTGNIAAGTLDVNGGAVDAAAVVGDVDQDGGTMTVTGSVTGDVTQKGASSDSFTAASVSGDVTQESGNLATVTTGSIGGNLEQNGGKVVAQGDALAVSGTTTQNGGTIGDANDEITLTGKLTQNGGTMAADMLAANDGAEISGTVTAATSLTATGKDVEVKTGGSLSAPTITAANLKTAGAVVSTMKINANVEQTAGTLDAKDVEGATFNQSGGAATLTGTLTAAVDQDAGTLSANAVVGNVDQDGGTMTVDTSVTGNVNQKGIATDSFTAASVSGNVTQEEGNLATVTTASIGGNLEQNGGKVVAQGDTLSISGTTTQNGGTIGDANDEITLTGKLTQNGGTMAADTLAANDGAEISGTVTAATSLTATDKDVEVKTGGSLSAPTITAANLKTAGTVVSTTKINANVEQTAGTLNAKDVEGATFKQTDGTATLTGTLTAAVDQDAGTLSANAVVGDVDQDGGTMTVDTSVTGNVNQKGTATDSFTAASVSGNVTQESGNLATVTTGSIGGNLEQNGGKVVAKDDTLTVDGTTTQNGGTIGDANDAITLKGKLTQTAGALTADALTLKDGAEQSGGKVVAKSLILDNAAADVTLASADNDFDTVKGSAANLTVKDTDGLDLAGVTVGGTLNVTAASLTDSAANKAKDVTLAVVGDAVLDNGNDFDTVKGSAAKLTVNDTDEVKLLETTATSGDLKVTAGGEITVDGEVAATTGGVLAQGGSVTVNADKSVYAEGNIRIEATGATGKVELNGSVKGANVSVLALNGGSVSQNANIMATATDGFVDVEATGSLEMSAASKTSANTIVYQGGAGTVLGKFDGENVNMAGVGIGGGAEITGEKVVLDVGSLGTASEAVKLNASEMSINAAGDIYVENTKDVSVKSHAGATGITVNRVQEDLSVANAGTVATSDIEGIISQNGNVSLVNEGNVIIESGAGVIAGADVNAVVGTIDVVANNGDVTLKDASCIAGKGNANVEATGDITLDGESTISSDDGNVTVKSTDQGDVTIGTVGASGSAGVAAYGTGTVTIETAKGSVLVKNGSVGSSTSTEVDVKAGEGSVDVAKGSLIANGDIKVQADGDVALANGTFVIASDGTVGITANRDAKLNGTITATASADNVAIQAGNTVEVGGAINAMAGTVAINADGTDAGDGVKVTGSVTGAKGVALTADGDVTVDGGLVKAGKFAWDGSTVPTVAADDSAALTMTAGKGVTLQNNAQVGASGTATVTANDGNVTVTASKLAANKALTVSAADADSSADDGSISVAGGSFVGGNDTATLTAAKDVTVNASEVAAVGDVFVKATAGKVEVLGTDAKIGSNAEVVISAGTDVDVQTGTKVWAGTAVDVDASGDVTVAGEVWGKTGVTVDGADVTVDGGTVTATTGDVTVGTDAATRIGGTFTAQNGATVKADAGSVKVYATGDVDIQKGTGVRTEVSGMAGVTLDAAGAVTVDGGVVKAGVIDEATYAVSGNPAALTMTAGKGVTIQDNAMVGASGTATVTANDGNVTVTASKLAANKALTVSAADADSSADDGSISVAGGSFVGGNNTATLTAANEITVNASEVAAVGDVSVTATGGKVEVLGTDAKIGSNAKVTLDAGTSVTVETDAKVLSEALIDIDADDDVTVAGTIRAKGSDDGAVKALDIQAGNNVKVSGTVEATAGTVAMNADGTDDGDGVKVTGSVTGATGVAMTADKDVLVDGGTVTAATGDVTVGTDAATRIGGAFTAQNGAAVKAEAGSVKVYAKDNVTVVDTARVEADENAALDAGNNVVIEGGILAENGKVDIAADAMLTVSDDGTVEATAGAVDLTAKNMIGISNEAEVTAGTSVTVKSTAEGDITIDTTKGVTANNGAVTIDNDNGVVTVKNAVVEAKGASGDVDIDATAGVTIAKGAQNAIVKAGKDILIDNAGTGAGNIVIGTDGLTDDGASLSAASGKVAMNNEAVGGEVQILGGANVSAKTDVDVDAVGSVRVDDSAVVKATDGTLTMDAASGSVTVADKADIDAKTTVGITAGTFVKVTESAQVDAGEAVTFTAKDGDVAVDGAADVTASKGVTLTASKGVDVLGDATVAANGGNATLTAQGEEVKVTGSVEASENVVVSANTALEISENGTVEATSGAVDLTAKNAIDISNEAEVTAGTSVTVKSTAEGDITIGTTKGVTANKVAVSNAKGDVVANGGTVEASESLSVVAMAGDIDLTGGKMLAKEADFNASGDINVDNAANDFTGTVTAKGRNVALKDANAINLGNVTAGVNGNVLVETVAGDLTVKDGATVQGKVTELSAKGNVRVNGTVSGADLALVSAQGGNVEFDADGEAKGDTVTVDASGNITQMGASVPVDGSGYANDQQLHAAVKANSANLIAGGSIGNAEQGTSDYVGVEAGSVAAEAGVDAAIAGANGSDINVDCVTAGADVSLFTTGTIRPNGTVTAGGNLTVSAKDFSGGAVKMNMSDALTVNNFQSGDKPLLAFFETNGGNTTPEINNQPNETIIFIDGRLAGGDIKTINLLGAVEAFPVQTPELKSEQGVFGNPLFLHDDLDVATPLAVGAIDYLLLELPRMELSSDFPIGVEKQVSANGLNPTTSYWFGQNPTAAEEDEADDANDDGKGESPTGNEGASPDAGSNPVTAMK